MQILIDNFDGNGSIDYSTSVQFGSAATIVRELNKPSFCTFDLVFGTNDLPQPSLHGRVHVIAESEVVLFTGYVAVQPQFYAGRQTDQGVFLTTRLTCVSDELLIDLDVSTNRALLSGLSAQQDWAALSEVLATSELSVSIPSQLSGSSRFEVVPGARWSEAAGELAANTGSAYRSIAGAVEVSTLGNTVHSVCADDPGLVFGSSTVGDLRWLANDVTVCGREEATAYVTEVFQGDGVTTSFLLSEQPFSPASTQKTMIADSFQGTSLNPRLWKTVDAGANLALTAAGLTCLGGAGREAETTVGLIQEIELGGSLTLEATGVQVANGSAGFILGLYAGVIAAANCFCGFAVSTSQNGVSISAIINGAIAGSAFRLVPNHLYTLRLRVSCPEMERTRQSYFYLDATGWKSIGGGLYLVEDC